MRRCAFTLIELLVVVTIIVVLLALLVPAMDKAIYRAELAVCEANKHALGNGVLIYAMGHKRYYPDRPSVRAWPQWPGNMQRGVPRTDDRPTLRSFTGLNATLNCPLIPEVDFEGSHDDAYVFSVYNLWFGFGYRRGDGLSERGMYRVGDRWTWYDIGNNYTLRSRVLASQRYFQQNNGDIVSATHPGDTYSVYRLQNETVAGFKFSLARWDSTDRNNRGVIDINALFDDGSVTRYERVDWLDTERMAWSPEYSDGSNFPSNHEIVPKP